MYLLLSILCIRSQSLATLGTIEENHLVFRTNNKISERLPVYAAKHLDKPTFNWGKTLVRRVTTPVILISMFKCTRRRSLMLSTMGRSVIRTCMSVVTSLYRGKYSSNTILVASSSKSCSHQRSERGRCDDTHKYAQHIHTLIISTGASATQIANKGTALLRS